MCNANITNEVHHQLWLIYTQLKDAESDAVQRLELLECARKKLGNLINESTRQGNFLQRKYKNG